MMRSEPTLRMDAAMVALHPVIVRARASMDELRTELGPVFQASALASVPKGWLANILGHTGTWDGDEDDESGMDVGL